jgi:hypothetical protein
MKYVHIVSITFPVLSKYSDGNELKPDMYRKIKAAIAELDANDELTTATKITQTYSLDKVPCG